MDAFKIKVNSEEESRKAQECLFKLGCIWYGEKEGRYFDPGNSYPYWIESEVTVAGICNSNILLWGINSYSPGAGLTLADLERMVAKKEGRPCGTCGVPAQDKAQYCDDCKATSSHWHWQPKDQPEEKEGRSCKTCKFNTWTKWTPEHCNTIGELQSKYNCDTSFNSAVKTFGNYCSDWQPKDQPATREQFGDCKSCSKSRAWGNTGFICDKFDYVLPEFLGFEKHSCCVRAEIKDLTLSEVEQKFNIKGEEATVLHKFKAEPAKPKKVWYRHVFMEDDGEVRTFISGLPWHEMTFGYCVLCGTNQLELDTDDIKEVWEKFEEVRK